MMESVTTKQKFIERAERVFVSDKIQYDDAGTMVTKVLGEKELEIAPEWSMTIFRYMSFSRLYTEINEKTITFISPQEWEDPFESAFFGLIKQYDVKCLCFTYNGSIGEEWAWKAYMKEEQLVRIEIIFKNFVELLSNAACSEKGSWNFYVTVCDYTMDKKDIVSCYKNATKFNRLLSLEEYLNLLSIKRKAFANEREIRIFAVSDSNSKDYKSIMSFNNIDYKEFISRVLLEPLPSFQDSLRRKYYSKLQQIHNEGIRNFFKKMGINSPQSRLYEIK